MEKATACRVLCFCVGELTDLLVSEIDQVVHTLIPFLKWYHDPHVECYYPKAFAKAAALIPFLKWYHDPPAECYYPTAFAIAAALIPFLTWYAPVPYYAKAIGIAATLIPFLKWYQHPPVADALVPPLERYNAKAIRIAAASVMPKILNSAREVVEFSDPAEYDQNMQYVEMSSDKVKLALEEALDVEPHKKVRLEMLDSLNNN
ncbi:unnamed protein product [Ilex paraguariensis]|uniref:Uncharacterized protein n=1 Tax=Ilex paraguariensis TaxID=185542 RepID=A0ABC8UCC3_9AQUA